MVGVLAYGSLIADPGIELAQCIVERISVVTPFNVEFKRSSAKRGGGPTLIPVSNGGNPVSAQVLIMNPNFSTELYKSMLWRRERGIADISQNYKESTPISVNTVRIRELSNFANVSTVLYTEIGQNIPEPVTGERLAELAIKSILGEAGKEACDGIRYLIDVTSKGIKTELSGVYKEEVLKRAGCTTLEDAMHHFDALRNGNSF